MASNHTSNFNLCQWEAGDKILRTDFNEDNAKIDAELKALEGKIPKFKAGWYRGDGAARQFVNVGFHPEGVTTFANFISTSPGKGVYGGVVGAGSPTKVIVGSEEYTALQIMDNGFYVFEASTGSADTSVHCNTKDVQYGYIAIGW